MLLSIFCTIHEGLGALFGETIHIDFFFFLELSPSVWGWGKSPQFDYTVNTTLFPFYFH